MSLDINDMVFYKDDGGKIIGGGYSIDSLLMNRHLVGGGAGSAISSAFSNIIVPLGLAVRQSGGREHNADADTHSGVIPDSLYDKLMGLLETEGDRATNMAPKTRMSRRKTKKERTKRRSG